MITRGDVDDIFMKGRQSAFKELFDKFDKYSCINNDKWYLKFKEEKLNEVEK